MEIISTYLICLMCGEITTIQRVKNKQKQKNHIKDMYCPICKKDSKYIELKDKNIYYIKLKEKKNKSELDEYVLKLLEEKIEKSYTYGRK